VPRNRCPARRGLNARSTDHAFLQSIIEHPEDDAPRLVYADWLEEPGQNERADLIRVQCQLAHLPSGDEQLAGVEQDLLEDNKSSQRLGSFFCRPSGK
jgi:uncharacterized protein (TIGR02996 family)